MSKTKNKQRLIHSIQEFENTYLPKKREKRKITTVDGMNLLGDELARKVIRGINIKI